MRGTGFEERRHLAVRLETWLQTDYLTRQSWEMALAALVEQSTLSSSGTGVSSLAELRGKLGGVYYRGE